MDDGAGVANAAMTGFVDKLQNAASGSDIMLMISPRVNRLPLVIQRYDDPFLPFGRAVIEATRKLVCGYLFDLAAYLRLGAAGAIALERTLPLVERHQIRILHGPFWGPDYADMVRFGPLTCDAATLVDDLHLDAYAPGAFVIYSGLPQSRTVHGAFWHEINLLTYPVSSEASVSLRVAGDTVLYAGVGDDFQQAIADALRAMQHV